MDTCVYILTDGSNSKIGISNHLDKRMSAYRTHNPNFSLFHVKKRLSVETARRIESVVKSCFNHLPSNTGKEWFKVRPEHMLRVVDFHMQSVSGPITDPCTIAAGPVPLSDKARSLLHQISSDYESKKFDPECHDTMLDEFAAAFGLGLPEHRLPANVVLKECCLPIDVAHCDPSSSLVQDRIHMRRVGMPGDDHTRDFYHLVELASGYTVAVCTARVSMPYPTKAVDGIDILANSEACGLRVFRHDKWSWHLPGTTALLLYLQKTPIAYRLKAWDGSFRKWVIENSKSLDVEIACRDEIEDVTNDYTFPMRATNWNELHAGYLQKFFRWEIDEDTLRDNYSHLFRLWRERQPLPPLPY